MSLVPVEMLEEDAADLQFPKDPMEIDFKDKFVNKTIDDETLLIDIVNAYWDETDETCDNNNEDDVDDDDDDDMEKLLNYYIKFMKTQYSYGENCNNINGSDTNNNDVLLKKLCKIENENSENFDNKTDFDETKTENKKNVIFIKMFATLLLKKMNFDNNTTTTTTTTTDDETIILINLMNKLIKYQLNIDFHHEFFTHIWNCTFKNVKSSTSKIIQVELIKLYPKILIELIENICNECIIIVMNKQNDIEDLNDVLLKPNEQYQLILKWCVNSEKYFQNFYKQLAKFMMTTKRHIMLGPNRLQIFLTNLLNDLKSNMKISEFYQHYDSELINYILVLNCPTTIGIVTMLAGAKHNDDENETTIVTNAIATATENQHIEEILIDVRNKNYLNFIVLITHHPKYLYMYFK